MVHFTMQTNIFLSLFIFPLTSVAVGPPVSFPGRVADAALPVVLRLAPGVGVAHLPAAERDALLARVVAPLPSAAVVVAQAPDVKAPDNGVALEAGRADAARVVEVDLADGAVAAAGLEAGVHAYGLAAGLGGRTVVVDHALVWGRKSNKKFKQ